MVRGREGGPGNGSNEWNQNFPNDRPQAKCKAEKGLAILSFRNRADVRPGGDE